MANPFKSKQRERPAWTAADQRSRINKALGEGRTQQALELARALFKHDPAAEHLDLVRQATLARARHLRSSGNTRDAATMLTNALDLGGTDFLKEVTAELSRCGAIRHAQELSSQLHDPVIQESILAQAADAAVRQGPAGRGLLPEALHAQFDLVRQAFAQAEAGEDEAARTSLQAIGLHSPFLEWKLFLRGLLAYYQNDDARALENWNRLDGERVPFRLAGPFRFLIDTAFRKAQTVDAQIQLQKAADQLQSTALAAPMRLLQAAMLNEKQLAQAFRAAENLLPALRQQAPALVLRLASCFYWAVISHGKPEDKNRYLRVFGPPADDPYLCRLEALALEMRDDLEAAHGAWGDFQRWLEKFSAWGSAELRQRARALVWNHMGINADRMSGSEPDVPPWLAESSSRPDAEQCFRKSIALAPDRLDGHRNLFTHYRDIDEPSKAIKAGQALLERFPDHVPTLAALADLLRVEGKHDQAVRLLQRAVKINPLERKLRSALATAHMFQARDLAEQRLFDAARAEYQAALALEEHKGRPGVLCRWAACEFKAKNSARAEELVLEACQGGAAPALVPYYMTIETVRCRLPASIKKRFSAEFAALLNDVPTIANVLEAVDLAVSHALSDVSYTGRKTHEKKVLAYTETALALSWTEDELEHLCTGLVILQAAKLLKKVVRQGQKSYPASPVFPLKLAMLLVQLGPRRANIWDIQHWLSTARRLAEALPGGDRKDRLFEEINTLAEVVGGFTPFGGPGLEDLNDMMDAFFGK